MDPATIVSIGSTLLGGLFGQKKEKYVVPDYAKIRKDAEAAGFNPLTALTMGPQGSVVSSGGTMGTAIADAGLMLADSLAKSKKSGILAKVQSENAELQRKVQNLTLRPKVGGVYARQQSVPTVQQALGVPTPTPSTPLTYTLKPYDKSVVDVPIQALATDYVADSGRVVSVKTGPDPEEVVSGVAINEYDLARDYFTRKFGPDAGVTRKGVSKAFALMVPTWGMNTPDYADWGAEMLRPAPAKGKPIPRPNQGKGGVLNYRFGY